MRVAATQHQRLAGVAAPEFRGPWRYALRNLGALGWLSIAVTLARLRRGPLLPGWTWSFEVGMRFLRHQTRVAFDLPDMISSRAYTDALVLRSALPADVTIEPVREPVRGEWYTPASRANDAILLYLHGGGYAYYTRSHHHFARLIAAETGLRTFALDYRLTPEHAYPDQLDDAIAAYTWLLECRHAPSHIALVGDSAGGNLALALALALSERRLPLPALVVGLCPWTDASNPGTSMTTNERFDWVERRMAERWSAWFCAGCDPRDPRFSPAYADLHALPPLYVQAGGAEILADMIHVFVQRAREQGCDVTLDVWEHMTHDFQAYSPALTQSAEAFERLRAVLRARLPSRSAS